MSAGGRLTPGLIPVRRVHALRGDERPSRSKPLVRAVRDLAPQASEGCSDAPPDHEADTEGIRGGDDVDKIGGGRAGILEGERLRRAVLCPLRRPVLMLPFVPIPNRTLFHKCWP